MIPTGHFYWDGLVYEPFDITDEIDAPPSGNAICYFNADYKPEAYKAKYAMVISIVLLVLGFTTKLFKLYRRFLWVDIRFTSRYMMNMVLRSASLFQRLFGAATLQGRIASNTVVAAHMAVCVWIDLCASVASDVFWLIVSVTWGTMKIVELRILLSHAENQDDTWTFGQLLPVLILALPIINLIEHFRKFIFQGTDGQQVHGIDDLQVEAKPNSVDGYKSSPSSDVDSTWILRPELFDEYYKTSVWMPWAVFMCVSHTFAMVTFLLQPDFTVWDDRLGKSVSADTVSITQIMALWFVFCQGAIVHVAIFLLSLVEVKFPFTETKWKRRLIMHPMVMTISLGLTAISMYTASRTIDLAATTDIWSLEAQGLSLYYFIGTLSLSGIAIMVWLLSVYLPKRRTTYRIQSHEAV
ncbi:hypothetical protein F5Y05DRAFT_407079 [Hypoxylon sp. FL0543]|nr:hypothetical protein F5Y05DRAFT_407079 [Hypoxylon sp. FL0543]